jgi:hypothetical protein
VAFTLKGDEATYVAMALSMAYDRDLAYRRPRSGSVLGYLPAGSRRIFLKHGKQFRVRVRATPPFLYIFNSTPDPREDRLYFGKGIIYSVAAAPLVWLLGMNGFLVFHLLLLAGAGACGTVLAARSRPAAALTFTLAFTPGVEVPVYAVFLTQEISTSRSCSSRAFLWLWEVAEPRSGGSRHRVRRGGRHPAGRGDLLKPCSNAPLVLPLVLCSGGAAGCAAFSSGRIRRPAPHSLPRPPLSQASSTIKGAIARSSTRRKGQRRPHGRISLRGPRCPLGSEGSGVGTDEVGADNVLQFSEITRLFRHNVTYFLFGRHFGLVPYCFQVSWRSCCGCSRASASWSGV